MFRALYLGKNIFSKKFKDNLFSRNLITLGIFFVVLYCWIVQLKNISSVIICIMCTLLGTYLPGKSAIVQSSKKSISIFILIALPVLSQFGSSTSASSNPNLLLITISLFPVIGILFYETKIKDKNSIFHLVLILIIGFQMISLNNSYETNLNTSEFIQVSGGNLKTSKQTASNIKEFQDGFSSARNLEPIRIIDLSFFHPGGALYLNQSAESLGTLDLFFSYTIDSQLKLIFSSYFSTILKSSTLLLVSTANVEVDRTQGGCQEIREWINRSANQKISNSVYLPKIRYVAVSIYKSSPSETTLYPQNLAILKQC